MVDDTTKPTTLAEAKQHLDALLRFLATSAPYYHADPDEVGTYTYSLQEISVFLDDLAGRRRRL